MVWLLWKLIWQFLKKIELELSVTGHTISVYLLKKKLKLSFAKGISTSTFILALVTGVGMWKQF